MDDVVLWIVVGTALAFDFTNGFHDTANAVATSVSTRAMPPRVAVGLASTLNFVGAFLSLSVAATIATGIVQADVITPSSRGKLSFSTLHGENAFDLDRDLVRQHGVPDRRARMPASLAKHLYKQVRAAVDDLR